jgi:PIN domain nuclease of toxin-antitoxin system
LRLLVDTQVWLWLQAEPERVSTEVRELLEDPSNEILFSAASGWEIGIKFAAGKLDLPLPPEQYLEMRLKTSGIVPLTIDHRHAVTAAALPLHHKDPFDRMLVAQAQCEGVALLSADRQLAAYDVEVLWA